MSVSKLRVSHMTNDVLLLFPGALGDFICFWPTLQTLRRKVDARMLVVARSELFPLVHDACVLASIDRREVADLFATGPVHPSTHRLFAGFGHVHSWTGHGDSNFASRLQVVTGGIVSIRQSRAMRPGEHASEYYARCVGVTPSKATFSPTADAASWAEDFWTKRRLGDRALIVHPGSGSPRKNWEGMAAMATWWREHRGGKVVTLLGPAEEHETRLAGDAAVHCEPLDRVAALLRRAHLYLGNDSGISHLAGLVGTRGLAIFGPSDPVTWRPLGDTIGVVSAPAPCSSCGPDRFCTHRLSVQNVHSVLSKLDPR